MLDHIANEKQMLSASYVLSVIDLGVFSYQYKVSNSLLLSLPSIDEASDPSSAYQSRSGSAGKIIG